MLTPLGLRTLSPRDKNYQGRYGQGLAQADQYHRDLTYHQGTVWPWTLGAYIDALVLAYGETPDTFSKIDESLHGIRKHILSDSGIGYVSEIFDGDAPFLPHGCIARAWSVAELLRVHIEYPQIINANKATLSALA